VRPPRGFPLLQNPLSVYHRDDQRLVILQAIDNPVAVDDELAYVLIVKFRHLVTRTWKACQNPRLIHNVLENNGSVGGESAAM
jgi:hypothetical protein